MGIYGFTVYELDNLEELLDENGEVDRPELSFKEGRHLVDSDIVSNWMAVEFGQRTE